MLAAADPASHTARDAFGEGLAEPAIAPEHDSAAAGAGVPVSGYEASIAALQALCVSEDFVAWEEAIAMLSQLRHLLESGMREGSLTDRMRAKYAAKELESLLGKGGELSRLAFFERLASRAKKATYSEQEDAVSPTTLKVAAGGGAKLRAVDHRAGAIHGEGGDESLADSAARILNL
jgi:hypothetical protein